MKRQVCAILTICAFLITGIPTPAFADYKPKECFTWRADLDDTFLSPENAWVYDLSENGVLTMTLQTYGTDYSPGYAAQISNDIYTCFGYRPDKTQLWQFRFSMEHLSEETKTPEPFAFDVSRDKKTAHHLMIEVLNGGTDTETLRLWMGDNANNVDPAHAKSSVITAVPTERFFVRGVNVERKDTLHQADENAEKDRPRREEEVHTYGYYRRVETTQHTYANPYFSTSSKQKKWSAPYYIDACAGQCSGSVYASSASCAIQFTLDTKQQDTTLSNNKRVTFTALTAVRTRDGAPAADVQLLQAKGNTGSQLYKANWKTILPYQGGDVKRTLRIGYIAAKEFAPGQFEYQPKNSRIILDIVFDSKSDTLLKETVLYWKDDREYHAAADTITCAGNFVERYLPVLYGTEAEQLLQKRRPQQQTAEQPDETQIAQRLQTLGLFSGTDTGFDLQSPFTRAQGAAMLVRLLGMETTAFLSSAGSGFDDVPAGQHWAAPYVGYCARQGITNGTGKATFSPDEPMTGAQYAALLLRAMGYTDAQPDTAFTRMVQIGILSDAQSHQLSAQSPFLRGGMIQLSWGALKAPGADGKTMTDHLISRGIITREKAQQVQLVAPPPAATIPQGDLAAMTAGILP